MKIIKGISEDEQLNIITWSYEYFKTVIDFYTFLMIVSQETNWDISAKLVDENDNIMGLYLLGDKQLTSIKKSFIFEVIGLNGVEGVLLVVDESIRNLGWGNKLKDYPKTLGVDYIWGQQLQSLKNLDKWLKRRVLVGEINGVYITMEKFN
jgi:hypothetical protein